MRGAASVRRGRPLAVGAVAALAATALVVAVLLTARQQAAAQSARTVQAAQNMLGEADAVRDRDPVGALQLGAAALRLTGDPRAEADLVQSLTTPFLAELPGHAAAITAIAWSPDGRRVATADAAGRVIVDEQLDDDRFRPVGEPLVLPGPVERATFTADGRLAVLSGGRLQLVAPEQAPRTLLGPLPGATDLLAAEPTGGLLAVVDTRLLRWTAAGDPSVATLAGAGTVTAAALSRDGRQLVTISAEAGAVLWDVTGPPRRLAAVAPPATEGALPVLDPGPSRLLIGAPDGTVAQWDIAQPRAPKPLPPAGPVVERTLAALVLAPDGTAQAAAASDGSITLTRDAATERLAAPGAAPAVLAFSPDGTRLLSGAPDGGLVVWDTGPDRGAVPGNAVDGHRGPLLSMAVPSSPHGPLVTGGDDGVLLWDVLGAGRLQRQAGRIDARGAVPAVALGDSDRTLAVGTSTGWVALWDLDDPGGPRLRREIALPGGTVDDLEFFPDGKTVAAAVAGVGVRLVDVGSGAVTALPGSPLPRALAVTPDGRRLVVADPPDGLVVWDVTDRGRPVVASSGPDGHDAAGVAAMALGGGGRLLVTAGRDGTLVLGAFDDPDRVRQIGEIRTGARDAAAGLLTVAVSVDGRTLAGAAEDGLIRLWDIADPSRPRPIGGPLQLGGPVHAVGLIADGLTLVAGGQAPRSRPGTCDPCWICAAPRSRRPAAGPAARWPRRPGPGWLPTCPTATPAPPETSGQDQLREERCAQYRFAGSASSASSPDAAASSAAGSSAARLLASCSGSTAPDSTIDTHGWASAAATASWSTGTPQRCAITAARSAAGPSWPPGASRPFATASFTITVAPASAASASAGPAEGSRRFQVAWKEVNSGTPETVTASARRTVAAWAGPEVETPTRMPRSRNPAIARCSGPSSSTPVSSVAECTWYTASREPSRASDWADCSANAAAEWSLTSWVGASIRQSPT